MSIPIEILLDGTPDDKVSIEERLEHEEKLYRLAARIQADSDNNMMDNLNVYLPDLEKREYKTIMQIHLSLLKGKMCDVFFSGVEKPLTAELINFDEEYLLMRLYLILHNNSEFRTTRELIVSRKDIRAIMRSPGNNY